MSELAYLTQFADTAHDVRGSNDRFGAVPIMKAPVMNMIVSLPAELADFVEAKVAAGRYSSSSKVVRDALRLMGRIEQRNADKLAYLRQAWQEGLDSGEAEELDIEALKAVGRARLAALKV